MRTVPSKRMSLLTESEARLVLASAPRNVAELSPRELRSKIQRTRRLMDKYQDQAKRQRREALGRKVPTRARRAEGNFNTRQKAEYFALTLERFEKQLARLERKASARPRVVASVRVRRAPARGASGGRKPARRTRAAGRTAKAPQRALRQKKGGALKQQRFPSTKRQAHASARGRRTQARSDQRR